MLLIAAGAQDLWRNKDERKCAVVCARVVQAQSTFMDCVPAGLLPFGLFLIRACYCTAANDWHLWAIQKTHVKRAQDECMSTIGNNFYTCKHLSSDKQKIYHVLLK